jgi:hypothetical protein
MRDEGVISYDVHRSREKRAGTIDYSRCLGRANEIFTSVLREFPWNLVRMFVCAGSDFSAMESSVTISGLREQCDDFRHSVANKLGYS